VLISRTESAERLLGFAPCLKVFSRVSHRRRELFAADFKTRLPAATARGSFDKFDLPPVLAGRDPLNKSLLVWAKSFPPGYILNPFGDRMEMAH
jgi:hypothetical protein